MILAVIQALEGDQETEIVRHLLRLRDSLSTAQTEPGAHRRGGSCPAEVINIVNNFFYEKLSAMPAINAYMLSLQSEH